MFDRSFLPPADVEFVLIGDTHYMLDVDEVEFDSRRRQTARVERALALVDSLDPDFVVHLGDAVQEFPGSDDFETAVVEADRQLAAIDAELFRVAGNHDVGDKPDPTMPTDAVTQESLDAHHERYGRSWYGWDRGGCHFVALNSQLMNSSLPAAAEQREWLEDDLRAADGPIFVFLHLPPFLHRPDEPALGHYDNLDQPARAWLLDLVRDEPVAFLFAGHSHFAFANRVGETRFRVVASPSFTRPGFGELFSSCPPPERGRDDRGKLGFHLVRVVDGDARLHHVRTGGETGPRPPDRGERLLARTTRGLAESPLGASLLRPISETASVPATFPSAIRQEVHNDYPALGCLEMGVNYVRTAIRDLDAELPRRKLAWLRREGVTVVGTVLSDPRDGPAADAARRGPLDEIEVRIPGDPRPTPDALERIDAYGRTLDGPVTVSPAVPGRAVSGKQHDRLRSGYATSELDGLNDHLAEHETDVDRVLCRIGDGADPWAAITGEVDLDALDRVGAVDWLLPSTDVSERRLVDRVARALFAVARRPASRLYLEPLRALDRTMDAAPGLLDRRCNPTAAFHVVRCLNTALFSDGRAWNPRRGPDRDGVDLLGLERSDRVLLLALPADPAGAATVELSGDRRPSEWRRATVLSLVEGRRRAPDRSGGAGDSPTIPVEGATLLCFER